MAKVLREEPYGSTDSGVPRVRKVIECECGAEVFCPEFTNTCDHCGADYNMSGQLLAPRSQWGEETGERPEDCVGPFDDDDLNTVEW